MGDFSHTSDVLSAEDLSCFDEQGYVVLRDAVDTEDVAATVAAIFEFLEMKPDDPTDWYREPLPTNGMVEMYHHPAMWRNRQSPRIHAAFTQLWGTHKLWVHIDRVGFKPPHNEQDPRWNNKGFLHLDAQLDEQPIRFGLQGVLSLADTTAEQGGFHCLPGWHKPDKQAVFAEMVKDKQRPSFYGDEIPWHLGVTPIETKAGDMVIWHRALPHGNGLNRTSRPRLAQYISLQPAKQDNEAVRQKRIDSWQKRLPPEAPWVQGDPRQWESQHGRTADLSALGRRLLGLDLWD